jgi:hypothetical protein
MVGAEGVGLLDARRDPAHVTMVVEAVGLNEAEPMVSMPNNRVKNGSIILAGCEVRRSRELLFPLPMGDGRWWDCSSLQGSRTSEIYAITNRNEFETLELDD